MTNKSEVTVRTLIELLREHFDNMECYQTSAHNRGECLCRRTKQALEAAEAYVKMIDEKQRRRK